MTASPRLQASGGSGVSFEVYASNSPTGPWTASGPYTATPATISSLSGRYAYYTATLTGSGFNTPTLTRVDMIYGGTVPSSTYSYGYDAAGNIAQKTTELPSGSGTVIIETRTNGAGWPSTDDINTLNQIVRNDVNTVVTSPSSNTTVTWRYTYDLTGNMLTRVNTNLSQTTTYTWNELNQLTQVQLPSGATVSYTYDVLGRMLTRTDSSGTTSFVWDGMNVIQETEGSTVTSYYSPNGMLMSFDINGTVYQVHADALGSVRMITTSTGTVESTFSYDAWGNQLLAMDPLSFPYRFVGGLGVRWDSATGLYYMRARWYDPTLQRFVSRDPRRSGNRYNYCENAPTVAIDPSGRVLQITGPQAQVQLLVNQYQTLTGLTLTLDSCGYVAPNPAQTGPGKSSAATQNLLAVINSTTATVSQTAGPFLAGNALGADVLTGAGYGQSNYLVDPNIEGANNAMGANFGYSWLMHGLMEGYFLAQSYQNSSCPMPLNTNPNSPFMNAWDQALGIENTILQQLGSVYQRNPDSGGVNYTNTLTGGVMHIGNANGPMPPLANPPGITFPYDFIPIITGSP